MWQLRQEQLSAGRIRKLVLMGSDKPLSSGEVVELWQQDHAFRDFFIAVLSEAPFQAYFWEMPPVTETSLSRACEFVLVDSPELATVSPDPRPFQDHLSTDSDGSGVAAFWNVGNDAFLIAPCVVGPPEAYPHLAAFVRKAPHGQKHAFLAAVGGALHALVGSRRIWTSTSGLGVSWLHVRLDYRPKYYTYAPYRQEGGGPWIP